MEVCGKFVAGPKFVGEKKFARQHPVSFWGIIFTPGGVFEMYLAAHKQLKHKITVSEFLRRKFAVLFLNSSYSKSSHTVELPNEQEFAIAVCGKVSSEDRVFYGLDHMELSG